MTKLANEQDPKRGVSHLDARFEGLAAADLFVVLAGKAHVRRRGSKPLQDLLVNRKQSSDTDGPIDATSTMASASNRLGIVSNATRSTPLQPSNTYQGMRLSACKNEPAQRHVQPPGGGCGRRPRLRQWPCHSRPCTPARPPGTRQSSPQRRPPVAAACRLHDSCCPPRMRRARCNHSQSVVRQQCRNAHTAVPRSQRHRAPQQGLRFALRQLQFAHESVHRCLVARRNDDVRTRVQVVGVHLLDRSAACTRARSRSSLRAEFSWSSHLRCWPVERCSTASCLERLRSSPAQWRGRHRSQSKHRD